MALTKGSQTTLDEWAEQENAAATAAPRNRATRSVKLAARIRAPNSRSPAWVERRG